jgi:hypothetical protein
MKMTRQFFLINKVINYLTKMNMLHAISKYLKFCFFYPIVIIASLIQFACNNEIEINGEYEDIHIIYSVLNPSQQRQFIRINRAFLTDDNVYDAALVPDSTNFAHKIDVVVQEFDKNSVLVRTYYLDTIHVQRTGDIFSGGTQPVYYFDAENVFQILNYNSLTKDTIWFNPDNSFVLKVNNHQKGLYSEAETQLIPSITINKPSSFSQFISFISDNTINIEIKSSPRGKVYEAKFILYYREEFLENPNEQIYKQIEWKLGRLRANRLTGNEDIFISYVPATFFSILNSTIPVKDNVKRFFGKPIIHGLIDVHVDVQLVLTVGTDELSTYIDVNSPSSSIIQDRPTFTNISNGIGIFTSKRILKINYELNSLTRSELKNNPLTSPLNFQ